MKESLSIIRIFTNPDKGKELGVGNIPRKFLPKDFMKLGWMFSWLLATIVLPLCASAQEPATPPLPQDPPAVEEKKTEEFALPSFMRKEDLAPAKSIGARESLEVPANAPAEADAARATLVPNEGDFTNEMTVGDIIVSPRQKLLKQGLADIRMEEVPIRDALRYLAEAAGINYILPDLETDKVTVNMRMPPFKAMEVLANNFGLGIYEEDGLWFIRKKDKASYFAKIYKLKNIHLGSSTSGGGTTSDDDNSNDNNNNDNNSTSNDNSSSSSSSSSSSGGGGGGDVVMTTLREILGINVDFGGTIGADGNTTTASGAGNASQDENTAASDYTYVSYDADANTLFIIATATQHQWVDQYLQAIDNPTNNIAIEAMFLESSRTPDQIFGIDWSKANSVTLKPNKVASSSSGSTTSSENRIMKLPFGGIMTASDLAWGLQVFETETDGQIARYPSVVTQNGREVKIETTQKIPLSAQDRVVDATTGNTTTVGVQDLGTQEIGTTITITPRQINESLVQLNISISISTGGGDTDSNTGRVTTNESSYEGTVNVPTGCTLAIGGLERIEETLVKSKMPWAGDIPLFGFMFKKQETKMNRSNIFLFITPTVLKQDTPDNIFMKKSEGLSRDWVEKSDDMHRAWRRRTIDPMVEKTIKEESKR